MIRKLRNVCAGPGRAAMILLLLAGVPSVAGAVSGWTTPTPGATDAAVANPPAAGMLGLKLVVSLVAVIGLILVLQRVARKWGRGLSGGTGPEQIRVVSQRPLGPRLSLAVVEVLGRTLLVGVSPQGIRQVADLGARSGTDGAAVPVPPVPPSRPDAAFEDELARRLSVLRERYPSVSDLEGGRA